jgi:hypothetical protein
VPGSSSPGSNCFGGTASEPCRSFGASQQSPRYSPSSSSSRGESDNKLDGGRRLGVLHPADDLPKCGFGDRASIPCRDTGVPTSGRCPGYRKDHVVPLGCGGPDVGFQSPMADHRRRERQGRVGTEIVCSTIMRSGLTAPVNCFHRLWIAIN